MDDGSTTTSSTAAGPLQWYRELEPPERRTFWACFMGWALDAMDVQIYSLALGAIAATFTLNNQQSGLIGTVTLFTSAFGGWLVGLLSDRVGRKPLILWSRVFLVVLIYPGFLWLNASPTPAVLFIVLSVLSLGLVGQTAPSITMLPEMFPKAVRASGMSLVYSVGVALFGGFAPFISTWLLNATGSKLAPAWYLVAMTAVSLLGLIWLATLAPASTGASTPLCIGGRREVSGNVTLAKVQLLHLFFNQCEVILRQQMQIALEGHIPVFRVPALHILQTRSQ